MKILFTLIILSILFPMFIFADSSVSTPIGASFTEQNSTKFKRNLDYNVRQANIKIIESQSENTEHDMDINWQTAAANLEHEVEILPQVTLDDTLFFENTDILIISSGVISISQNRRDIIQQYVQQGGNAYIQGEYLSSYDSNQLFQQIVNNLGGFCGKATGFFIKCYSTGKPKTNSITEYVGGFGGFGNGSYKYCFWDKEASGMNRNFSGAIGKTTKEMMIKKTFTNYDFKTVWKISENKTYPTLRKKKLYTTGIVR